MTSRALRFKVLLVVAVGASGFAGQFNELSASTAGDDVWRADTVSPIVGMAPIDSTVSGDTVLAVDNGQSVDSVAKKRNFIQKIVNYFEESNKPKPEKKFDISFIGGPSYSNDTKLSLGLLGAGLYKSVPFDPETPQSNVSLYSDFSITGFYLIGIKGDHIGPKDSYRVHYKVYFNSFPSKFWGIGYDEARHDDNETEYLQLNSELKADIEFKVAENLYIGPAAHFNYAKAKDNDDWRLWNGESLRTTNYGLGFNLSYDSRDDINNAYSGWHVGLQQRFYPRFMKNSYCFSSTDFNVNHYFGVWSGGVLACRLHSLFTYGDTPWPMLATIGGSHTMRGYYEGRYRDKCAIDATVEIRQHVYHRNSVVAWIGAGEVFPSFDELRTKKNFT